ncbi:RICIN domain-containing protein [Streptomyces sp. CG1]|uniref:RICIN domain-containing protein n=1 Tax=Streptomyces sp. CG1 TaxID=1287523 RepID=UPI0034E19B62
MNRKVASASTAIRLPIAAPTISLAAATPASAFTSNCAKYLDLQGYCKNIDAMKRVVKFAGLAMSAVFTVVLLPNTSVADTNDGPVTLVNKSNGKCLEVENSSKSDGARVQMWDCNGQPGAKWEILSTGFTTSKIVNVNSGKCLEIADSRMDNGAPAQQWNCVYKDTQRWNVGTSTIENVNSAKFLEVSNGSADNGARVQQWSYANLEWQHWSFGN